MRSPTRTIINKRPRSWQTQQVADDDDDKEYLPKRKRQEKPRWTSFVADGELPALFQYFFVTKEFTRKTSKVGKPRKQIPRKQREDEPEDDEDEDEEQGDMSREDSGDSDDDTDLEERKDSYVPDKKLPPLKKFFRSYFSPTNYAWEIDYMHSGLFTFGTSTVFRYYLICININTKYSRVYTMNKNEHYDTEFSIQCIDDLTD
jgi:hypothetical protein